jgi:hypothetical protein
MTERTRNQRGAAAVEMALILPILILLVFGIVQFSIAFNNKQGLHAAAREGARFGALPQHSKTEITSRVEDALEGVVDPSDTTITVHIVRPNGSEIDAPTQPCDLQAAGTRVKVIVSIPHQTTIPLMNFAAGTLTGKGEFRCE